MVCDTLFDFIESNFDFYVKVWEDVTSIESPTECKAGNDAIGEYFSKLAYERGFSVERCAQSVSGDVVSITMNQDSDEPPIVFSGHVDTVHPIGSFGAHTVRREGTKIFGPGVMDCKGGVVAAFFAMDALRASGFRKRPVILILQTDEEQNSRPSKKDTIRYMVDKSKDAIAFINCESSKDDTLVLYRKGILQFEFYISGKAIHSSRCPFGVSAIAEAARKITELEKLKDFEGITCNCGIIKGGTADNTVPADCYFTADIRFMNNQQLDCARKLVNEIANTSYVGAECRLVERALRPAMSKSDANDNLLAKINAIFESVGISKVTPRLSLGGSDAAYTTEAGIPTVDSIGVSGDFIHTVDEYANVDSLKMSAKKLAAIAYYI